MGITLCAQQRSRSSSVKSLIAFINEATLGLIDLICKYVESYRWMTELLGHLAMRGQRCAPCGSLAVRNSPHAGAIGHRLEPRGVCPSPPPSRRRGAAPGPHSCPKPKQVRCAHKMRGSIKVRRPNSHLIDLIHKGVKSGAIWQFGFGIGSDFKPGSKANQKELSKS